MYIRCKYCVFFHADGSECREDSAGKQAQTSSGYWCGKWVHRETGTTFLQARLGYKTKRVTEQTATQIIREPEAEEIGD